MCDLLKVELNIYEEGAERHFYSPLIAIHTTRDHDRYCIGAYHEIDAIVKKLENTEMDAYSWLIYAKDLKNKAEHHPEDEEYIIFQLAYKALSERQKDQLEDN